MSDEIPLIWTSKGNLPIESLKYRHAWNETPEEISFVEEYLQGEEVVKRNVHVYLKKGLDSVAGVGGVN